MYAPLLVRKCLIQILPFKKYYPAALHCELRSKLRGETCVSLLKNVMKCSG